jgi:hypothetical protein
VAIQWIKLLRRCVKRERESFLLYLENIFRLLCIWWYSGRAYVSACQGLGFKIEILVFYEFYVAFATALMLKHPDLMLDILKIEAARYEKILLANTNANVQKYAHF